MENPHDDLPTLDYEYDFTTNCIFGNVYHSIDGNGRDDIVYIRR